MNKSYFIDFNPNYWSNRNIISEDISKSHSEASVTELITMVAENNFESLRSRGFSSRPRKWSDDEVCRADLKSAVGSKIVSLFPMMKSGGLSSYLRFQMTNRAKGKQFNDGIISKLENILTNPDTSFMINGMVTDILALGAISKNDVANFKTAVNNENDRIDIVKQWKERINTDSKDLDIATRKILVKSIGSALLNFKQIFKEEKGNPEAIIDAINDWKESYLDDANKYIDSLLDVLSGNNGEVVEFLLERELNGLVRKRLITEKTKTEFLKADNDKRLKTLQYWANLPKIYNKFYNREKAVEFLEADEEETKKILYKWACVVNPDNAHSLFVCTWLNNRELVENIIDNALKRNAEKAIDVRKGIGDVSEKDYIKATKGTAEDDLRRGVYDDTGLSDEDKALGRAIFKAIHSNDDNYHRFSDDPEALEALAKREQERHQKFVELLKSDDEAEIDWYADDDEDEESFDDVSVDDSGSTEDMSFNEDEENSQHYVPGMEEYICELISTEDDDYKIATDVIEYFDLPYEQEVVDFITNMARVCRRNYKVDYSDSFGSYDEENTGYDDDDYSYDKVYTDYDHRENERLEDLVDRLYNTRKQNTFKESYDYDEDEEVDDVKFKKAMELAKWILVNRCIGLWSECMKNLKKLEHQHGKEARAYGFPSVALLMQKYYEYINNPETHTSDEKDDTSDEKDVVSDEKDVVSDEKDKKDKERIKAIMQFNAEKLAKGIMNHCKGDYDIFVDREENFEERYGDEARKLGYDDVSDLIDWYIDNHAQKTNKPTQQTKTIVKYMSDADIMRNFRLAKQLGLVDDYGNIITNYYNSSRSELPKSFTNYKGDGSKRRVINWNTLRHGSIFTRNPSEISGILNLLSQRDPGAENTKYSFTFKEPIPGDSSKTHEIYDVMPNGKRNNLFKCKQSHNIDNAGEYTFYQLKNGMIEDELIDGKIDRLFTKMVDHDAYNFDISPIDIAYVDIIDGDITICAKYPKASKK